MPRILREPLFQFLLLGALLFGAYWWFGGSGDERSIIVSAATIAALREEQRHLTGREPAEDEVRSAIERWVDSEVLLREARVRGLDADDVIVRRRLAQKMQFLVEDTEPIPEPKPEQLREFFERNAERYGTPERISFVQVFAGKPESGGRRDSELAAWREQLLAGADPATVGETFVRGRDFRLRSRSNVTEVFGVEFERAVFALPVGEWSQVIASSFGFHLVRVGERTAAQLPAFEVVRERVRDDWVEARRGEINRAALQRLRASFRIELERSATR